MSLCFPVFGSWPSRPYRALVPFQRVGLKLNQTLIGHFHSSTLPLVQYILTNGQIIDPGEEQASGVFLFCDWTGFCFCNLQNTSLTKETWRSGWWLLAVTNYNSLCSLSCVAVVMHWFPKLFCYTHRSRSYSLFITKTFFSSSWKWMQRHIVRNYVKRESLKGLLPVPPLGDWEPSWIELGNIIRARWDGEY